MITLVHRILAVLLFAGSSVNAQTITQVFGSGAYSFSMEFVTIGNPNNSADTVVGSPNPFGSVSYVYNLGKYEVSRDMVLKASTAGGLGLTLQDMSAYGGNGLNRPATGISWNEAARFVNWLNTSKGYQAAYNFTTSGINDNITAWSAEVSAQGGINRFRHKDAYYFLPNVDEWYKGAYGDPSGAWYKFPNGSNTAPESVSAGTNGAVYGRPLAAGPADIADAGGLSPFGTMAQGGNVYEWNESTVDRSYNVNQYRDQSGGDWYYISLFLQSSERSSYDPSTENYRLGFRVAMIPEPSLLSLLITGGAVLMASCRKRRV